MRPGGRGGRERSRGGDDEQRAVEPVAMPEMHGREHRAVSLEPRSLHDEDALGEEETELRSEPRDRDGEHRDGDDQARRIEGEPSRERCQLSPR